MPELKILILEDEPLVAASLMKLVKQLQPDAAISGPIASVAEAMQVLDSSQPDLIISDIQLADGISLDIFTGRKTLCPVIFTTAFDEYAIRAFKVNSIDYLLKPIDKKELQLAMDKFHQLQTKVGSDVYLDQLNEFLSDFRNSKKYKERFTVHHGRNMVLVNSTDIVCLTKEEVIYLVHNDGKKYITDFRSLDEVEELLNPEAFYRGNRQFIISLPYIESMRSDETGKIIVKLKLANLPDVVVSKERAASFRRWVEG